MMQSTTSKPDITTSDTISQRGPPWGLARISHPPGLKFPTFARYDYDANAGLGVNVYVIDTGIFTSHIGFEGRAKWGVTILENNIDDDGNGRGTHLAGTIASRKYGVAKKANVIASAFFPSSIV